MDRPPRFIVEPSREGPPTLVVAHGESRSYLHSRVSPSRERHSLLAEFHPDRYDVLIVLGVGLGYHLLPLSGGKIRYRRVLLIDILPGIEAEISRNTVTSRIINAGSRLVSGSAIDEIETIVNDFIAAGIDRGIQVIEHPASIRLFPEYYGSVREIIRRAVDRFGGNTATRTAFGPRYLRNAILNMAAVERSTPVTSLYNRLTGVPGVVVTSGPTLDRVLPLLKRARSRVALIAVDSAVPSLTGAGITPDIAVSIDPQQHVCEHFAHGWSDTIATVFSPTSYPLAPRRRPGFLSLNTHPVSQLLEELRPGATGSIDSLTGTVAGDAVLLAHRLGLSPIALAGFDFCFPGHTIYARNTAYQRRFTLYFQDRFSPVETRNLTYIMKSSGGYLIDGRYSRRSFESYRSSIESLLRRESIQNVYRLESTGVPLEGAGDTTAERFLSGIPEHPTGAENAIGAVVGSRPAPSQRAFVHDLRAVLSRDDVRERLLTTSLGDRASGAIIDSLKRKMVYILDMEETQ